MRGPRYWESTVDARWHRPSTSRTILEFDFAGDALAVADAWAARPQHLPPLEQLNPPTAELVATDPDGTRLYACNFFQFLGGNKIVRPGTMDRIFVSIRQDWGRVRLEAWLSEHGWYRIFAPPEQAIWGGGWRQRLARWEARNFVNPLLEALGQPPIANRPK